MPLVTLRFGKLTEVFFEVSSPDHRKDIDDGSTVTVDDVGVIFAFEPAMPVNCRVVYRTLLRSAATRQPEICRGNFWSAIWAICDVRNK